MITGNTKNLGVIGYPIAHSLSPVLQNTALKKEGLDYIYVAFPVKPEQLKEAVDGIRAFQIRGVNVTIPHKTSVVEYLDRIDEDAKIIGAVNTIVNEDGYLVGYNTDAAGFMDALLRKGFQPKGKSVSVLGAGGAARAVIWSLIKGQAARIRLVVRNVAKAKPVADFFCHYADIEVLPWEDDGFLEILGETDLLVNTTPLGMYPKVEQMPFVDLSRLKKGALVYDIIYTPAETKLLRKAKEAGFDILNGEGMLAGQGAEAFRLWTGILPDVESMKSALREYLQGTS